MISLPINEQTGMPKLDQQISQRERTAIYRRYAPAYSYGWRERIRRGAVDWAETEPELERGWKHVVNHDVLTWQEVRGAVRAGWDHVSPRR